MTRGALFAPCVVVGHLAAGLHTLLSCKHSGLHYVCVLPRIVGDVVN